MLLDTSISQGQCHDASQNVDPEDGRWQRVLGQFHNFPFSEDEAFQQGLSGILGHESVNDMSDEDRSELVLKTKVFYFNRVTGHNISLEDVQSTHAAGLNRFPAESGNECNQTSGENNGETRVLTLDELRILIEHGETDDIPNNKVIPDTLNDGVPSVSTAPLRSKPWEVASQS